MYEVMEEVIKKAEAIMEELKVAHHKFVEVNIKHQDDTEYGDLIKDLVFELDQVYEELFHLSRHLDD